MEVFESQKKSDLMILEIAQFFRLPPYLLPFIAENRGEIIGKFRIHLQNGAVVEMQDGSYMSHGIAHIYLFYNFLLKVHFLFLLT
jgi:DNA topoisomerase VI subunit A